MGSADRVPGCGLDGRQQMADLMDALRRSLEARAAQFVPVDDPEIEYERACGLCRRYGHKDAECPTNPENWPRPFQ